MASFPTLAGATPLQSLFRLVFLVLLGTLLSGSPVIRAAAQDQPLEPRIPAGEIYLEALDGPALTAGDLARGDVLAVFWASWSPRSRDIGGRLRSLRQRWGGRARVIAVNFQEDAPTIHRFLGQDFDVVPVFLDLSGAFARRHGVTTLPALVIFRQGEGFYQGRLTDDADGVISQTLGEE